MALEDIINKIIKDAQAHALEIKEKAELEAQEILSKARLETETLRSEIFKENQKKKDIETGGIAVKANLKRRNRLLRARRTLIEECFKKAEKEFFNSNLNIKKEFFKHAILENVKEGDETIIISQRYRGFITDEFLNSINIEIEREGRRGRVRVLVDSQREDLFILKAKFIETDLCIGSAINNFKRDIESEIAGILFELNYYA